MIIFTKLFTKLPESILSKPTTWDEYRIIIGEGSNIYSQARARTFNKLDSNSIEDIIDYLDKVQLLDSNYTLNIFASDVIGATILDYIKEMYKFDTTRSNNFSKLSDPILLSEFIRIHDAIIRQGISF